MSGKLTNAQIAQKVTSLIPQFLRDFITAHELFEKAVAKRTDGLDATDSTEIRKILNKGGLGDAQKRLYAKDGNTNRFIYNKLQALPKATQQRFYELIVKPMMTGQDKATVKSASTFDAFFTARQKTLRDKLIQQLDTIDMTRLMASKPVPIDTLKFGGDLFLKKLKEYVDGGKKPQISATERLDEYAKFIGMPETSQTLTTPAPAPAPTASEDTSGNEDTSGSDADSEDSEGEPTTKDPDEMTRDQLDTIKKDDDGRFYDEEGETVSVAQIQGLLDSLPSDDPKREEWAEKLGDAPSGQKKLRGAPSDATPAKTRSKTATAEAGAVEGAPTATATAPTPAPTQPKGPSEEQKRATYVRLVKRLQDGLKSDPQYLKDEDEMGSLVDALEFLAKDDYPDAQRLADEVQDGDMTVLDDIIQTALDLKPDYRVKPTVPAQPYTGTQPTGAVINPDEPGPVFMEGSSTGMAQSFVQEADRGAPGQSMGAGIGETVAQLNQKEQRDVMKMKLPEIKRRIEALHIAYDNLIPEFRENAHTKSKNDALQTKDIKVARRHLIKMLQRIQAYYDANTALKVGVIIPANVLMRQLFEQQSMMQNPMIQQQQQPMLQNAPQEGGDGARRLTEDTLSIYELDQMEIAEVEELYAKAKPQGKDKNAFVDFVKKTGLKDQLDTAYFYFDNAQSKGYTFDPASGGLTTPGRPGVIVINNTYDQSQVNNQFIQNDQRQQTANVGMGGTGSGLPMGASSGAGMAGMTGMSAGGQMSKPHSGDVLHKAGDKFGHAMSVSTYYRNSGMEAFQRKGVARHSIVPQPMKAGGFNLVKDPRPLANVPALALRALDNRPRGKPKGFKIKT